MTVAVVGGLDRLGRHYTALADEHEDMEISFYPQIKPKLADKIANTDGVVLVTNLVSHTAAREVYRLARDKGLPVIACHRASVSAMRQCLSTLATGAGDAQGNLSGDTGRRR